MSFNHETIKSKKDLHRFIREDLKARGLKCLPGLYQIRKPIVHFTVLLRNVEYLQNTRQGYFGTMYRKVQQLRLKLLGAKLGFSIFPNTFAPGLYLVHWGSIAISAKARFGANARVHTGVSVSGAPVVGKNVYLGPGAIVVGDITIGDNVTIGANTVVYSSFPDNVTILGNPARVVKKKS